MKVKVGSEWIDSDDQPLAVEFTDIELDYIKKEMTKESAPNNRFAVGRWLEQADGTEWVRECDE